MTARQETAEALHRLTGWNLGQPLAEVLGDTRLARVLSRAGIVVVFDFLRTPRAELLERRGIGPRIWERTCQALVNALGAMRDVADHDPPQFPAILRRVRDALDETDRRLLDAIFGIGRRATTPQTAAIVLRLDAAGLEPRLRAIRDALAAHARPWLDAMLADARRELLVHDGVLGIDSLASGSALREASNHAPDPLLPLRLIAFWSPESLTVEGDHLCAIAAKALPDFVRAVRGQLERASPPIRVADLVRELGLPPRRHALLLHVLVRVLGLGVTVDPRLGELVGRPRRTVAERLELLLLDASEPVAVDDLLFRHRDRFGAVKRARLNDALFAHGTFLEVGPRVWSLRARHLEELELLRPEAERIAKEIVATDARRSLGEAVRSGALSERSAFLLADLLRRESSIRPLGRGEFVPRRRGLPPLVAAIADELRRAMGEVPFARFLQNQAPARQRLVARLLRVNRCFVSPSRDRVDLLEHWPFDPARLLLLLRTVRIALADRDGYAPLARLREPLAAAGFDHEFLTEHLVLDLLRRHGDFDLLPGGIVAERGVGLARRILSEARKVLRAQPLGLSLAQMLAERPDLAEFECCLRELLHHDPLVQSQDGLRYQVI